MEVRGQGNATYHFHFHALAQQVAANAFRAVIRGCCHQLSVPARQGRGREGRSLSVCQSTLQD